MKSASILLSLTIVSSFIVDQVKGKSLDHPTFNSKKAGLESFYSPIKPSNLISYDHNSGALLTSFDIGLSQLNKDLRSKLSFGYSSYSTVSSGFGIGFRLNLPRFYKNPSSLRGNYLLEYKNQIVEYTVDGDTGYEQDLTFFSSLELVGETYIITFPSGAKLYFSKNTGNILREEASFNKAFMSYVWNESGHLQQVTNYNGSEVKFKYTKCNFESKTYKDTYRFNSFIQGRVVDSSLCADSIVINGEEIHFKYTDGHLNNVYWKDNPALPIFHGEYGQEIENTKKEYKVYGVPGKETTALKLGEYGVRFQKHTDLLKRFSFTSPSVEIGFNTSATIGFMKELDINNDGISDLILEKIDHEQGVRVQETTLGIQFGDVSPFGDYVYRESDNKDAQVPRLTKKSIYIALGMLNKEKNDIQFYVDENYKLPESFNTLSATCLFTIDNTENKPLTGRCNNPGLSHWDEHEDETGDQFTWNEPSANYKAVILKNASLLVGDFNGDKFVDVLYCSKKSKSIVYGKAGGTEAAVAVDIPCTSQSTSMDLNLDGFSDLVTTDGSYLNLNQKFEKIENDFVSPLVEYLNDQLKLQDFSEMSEGQLDSFTGTGVNRVYKTTLYKKHIDKLNDTKLFFDIKKSEYIYDKEEHDPQLLTRYSSDSGTYLFIGENIESEYYSTGTKKRIVSITTSLGAKTQFKYTGEGASPILVNVKKNNMDQVHEEDLAFSQVIINQITGAFLGYKFLHKKKKKTTNSEGSEKIIHFYSDGAKKDMLKRTPIHGEVSEIVDCKSGACSKLVSFIHSPSSNSIPLDEAEFIQIKKWNVLYSDQLGSSFKKDQYIKKNFFNSTAIKMIFNNMSVFKSLESKTKIKKITTKGPLEVINEKSIGINSSSFGTEVSGTGIFEKTVEKKINYKGVILPSSIIKYDNVAGIKPISKTTFRYENNIGEKGFSIIKEESVSDGYTQKTKVLYDNLGRVEKTILPRGDVENNIYTKNETIIEKSTKRQRIVSKYSLFGDVTEKKNFDAGVDKPYITQEYTYESPGVLIKVTQNNRTLEIKRKIEGNLNVVLSIKKDGVLQKNISRTLDHLGNTILEKQDVNGKTSLVLKNKYDANGNIIQDFLSQLNSVEEVPSNEYFYDFNGRMIEKNNVIVKQVHQWSYEDNHKTYLINQKLISKEELMPGGIRTHIFRGDKKQISVEDDFQSGVSSLFFDDLNLKYKRDYDGGVSGVISNDLIEMFTQKRSLFSISTDDIIEVGLDSIGNIQKIDSLNNNSKFKYNTRNQLESYETNTFVAKATYNNLSYPLSNEFDFLNKEISYKENISYNKLDLIESIAIKTKEELFLIENVYDGQHLVAINGLIKMIEYDNSGGISTIEYESGLKVGYERDALGQLNTIVVTETDGKLKKETYERNDDNLLSKMTSTLFIDGKEKITNYNYSNDLRFLGSTNRDNKNAFRDEYFSLSRDTVLSHKTNILQFDEYLVNYSIGNQITGLDTNAGNTRDEFLRDDLHYIKGVLVKYIEVNNTVVGALIFKEKNVHFYPIVTDVRGSVRLVYGPKAELVLMKNYDAWGHLDRKNFISENNIANLIVLDYSKLKRMDTNSDFLIAKHRVYDSSLGQWLSIDPMLLTNIDAMLSNRYYELDGLSYAAGDPVNFIDPSGHWATEVHNHFNQSMFANTKLSSYISDINIGSKYTDRISAQFTKGTEPIHSMRGKNMSISTAKSMRHDYMSRIAGEIQRAYGQSKSFHMRGMHDKGISSMSKAANLLGQFLHPVQDSTSPAHSGWKEWGFSDTHNHGVSPFSLENMKSLTPTLMGTSMFNMRSSMDQYGLQFMYQ